MLTLDRSEAVEMVVDTRRATGGPRKRTLCSTLRRPTERNAGRTDDFVAAVENLCIFRAKSH